MKIILIPPPHIAHHSGGGLHLPYMNPTLRNALVTVTSFLFVITALHAWTGPTVSAPGGNVATPLTISATSQSKAGGLDVGWLSAVGAVKVGYTATACTADLAGALRWNIGVMEYCNGTVWGPFVSGGTGGGSDSPYCAYMGQNKTINLSISYFRQIIGNCTMSVDETGYQTLSVAGRGAGVNGDGVNPTVCSKLSYNSDSVTCTFTPDYATTMPSGEAGVPPVEVLASFDRNTGVFSCKMTEQGAAPVVAGPSTYTFPKDASMCSTGGGAVVETDPTIPANLKDGVSWGEVTGKPTDMVGAGSLCGWSSGSFTIYCQGHNPVSSCPGGYTYTILEGPSGWDSGGYMNPGVQSCVKN